MSDQRSPGIPFINMPAPGSHWEFPGCPIQSGHRLPTLSRKGCARCFLTSFTGSLNLIISPLADMICCWILLRTWYFIFPKRSTRKEESSRGSEPRPCTQRPGSRAATCSGKASSGIASDPLRSVSRVNPEMKHCGSLSAHFSFASSWQLIFPSVLFQETCVFFFVCFVDLPQLVLTAVDSVKWTHYKNPL